MPDKKSEIADLKAYGALRRSVEAVLAAGQQEMAALKVRTYWQTGRLIQDYLEMHPQQESGRGDVFDRLSRDLQMERTLFYRTFKFARAFPSGATWHLNWSQYKLLLPLEPAQRQKLAEAACRDGWSVEQLKAEVRRFRPERGGAAVRLVEPKRGEPGTVTVGWLANADGSRRPVLDLGFSTYMEMTPEEQKQFEPGQVLRWHLDRWQAVGTEADRFFYRADLERVVDGDTLLVQIHMPFNQKRRQYLRLARLNAEALKTAPGERARNWLRRQLAGNSILDLRTHKTDRYDRYIAEVWSGDLYLNQALLDKGLAVPV